MIILDIEIQRIYFKFTAPSLFHGIGMDVNSRRGSEVEPVKWESHFIIAYFDDSYDFESDTLD